MSASTFPDIPRSRCRCLLTATPTIPQLSVTASFGTTGIDAGFLSSTVTSKSVTSLMRDSSSLRVAPHRGGREGGRLALQIQQ